MGQFFSLQPGLEFKIFSTSHLAVLALAITVYCILYFFRSKLKKHPSKGRIGTGIALALLSLELALRVWEKAWGIWSLQGSLPLHLCSISLLFSVAMLLSRSYALYEITYFWGVGGAIQALLTPDIWYGFPHFIFFQFFTAHSLIVLAVLWMTFVEGMRPSLKSLGKAFLSTNIYAVFVGAANYLLGSNYLYLCRKTANPSLLDYLHSWPWYILELEIITLVVFMICYLPFFLNQGRVGHEQRKEVSS